MSHIISFYCLLNHQIKSPKRCSQKCSSTKCSLRPFGCRVCVRLGGWWSSCFIIISNEPQPDDGQQFPVVELRGHASQRQPHPQLPRQFPQKRQRQPQDEVERSRLQARGPPAPLVRKIVQEGRQPAAVAVFGPTRAVRGGPAPQAHDGEALAFLDLHQGQ